MQVKLATCVLFVSSLNVVAASGHLLRCSAQFEAGHPQNFSTLAAEYVLANFVKKSSKQTVRV